MSASNRIGIKVNVEFPTITELRNLLESKVNSSIDGANFHKIKIDVNETSIASARKKIRDSLTKDAYEIKITTKDAIDSINKLNKKIQEIDNELKGTRKLRVSLDVVNLNSSLKDLMSNMTKVQNQSKESLSQGMKGFTDELEKADKRLNSISKKYKLNRNGDITNVTTSETRKDALGSTEKTTYREDAKGMTADVEYLHSKEKALQAVRKQLKDVFEIEQSMSKARHNNDNDTYERLAKQLSVVKRELNELNSSYKERYGESYDYENDIQKLKQKQQLERDILSIQQKQENAKKEEQAEEERLAQIQKEQLAFEKEIANAVSKVAQLEQKRFEIKKSLQNAGDEEKQSLKELYAYYGKIIAQINEQHDLQGYMNNEQREALKNQKELNNLVLKAVQAKAKDKQQTKEQKEIAKQLADEYKDILKLQEKIAVVQGQQHKDGSATQLKLLQQSLEYAKLQYKETMNQYEAEGKVTNEMRERLSNMAKLSAEQVKLIQNEAKMVKEQEDINNKYKEWQQLMSKINQLQRDLVFAGNREEAIIAKALSVEQSKANVLREELTNSRLITAERKREIEQIEQAQREQKQLNSLRQQARETDREFNTTGGVANFYSVYSNYSQAFKEILSEVSSVDEAFMKIKKVAEATDETLQQFKETSYDTASSFGVTAVDYMSAVEKWVTAGYTLQESEKLAKTSTVGSFVGNVDAELMAKWLAVPLNAYESSLVDADDIINVMNETSNKHAVEMEELGKAYMRSASSVTTAGVSFSELTGMITAAQEATRIGGERIGTSLKAISSNYGSIKSQLTGQQQTKHDWFENTLGISIDETETMTELFDELAKKWKTMDGVQKNTATFYLAGKEHQNIITAIMNEWDTYQAAMSDANFQLGLGEDGSAYKEFAQQKDSVRFQLAEVQNAWTELMNTIGESNGLVKNVLSIITEGLQKLNDVAQNEKLMNILQLILLGVGFHAGTNGILRVLDLMNTGLRNVRKNATETLKAFKALITPSSELDIYGNPISGRNTNNSNNGRNNTNNGDNNSNNNNNTGGSTIVGGVGGRRRSDRNNNNGRSNTNNRNNNNDNDNDNETSANGRRRSQRTDTSDLDNTVEGTTKKLSALGKVAKGVIGFLPLFGDALLVFELMGFDVFGGIGKMLDGMFESTNEYVNKVKKAKEELEDDNMFANGDIDMLRHELNDKDSGYRAQVENAKNNNSTGQFTSEEFDKFKEEFNTRVQELGFSSEIEITWNDYEDIMNKIDKYEEALDELEQKEAKDYAKKTIDILGDTDKGMEIALEDYQYYKERIADVNEELEKQKKLQKEAKEKGDESGYDLATNEIDIQEKKLKKLEKKAKEAKDSYAELGTTFANVGESLSKLNAEDVADILGNIEDKEQVTKIVAGLGDAYDKSYEKLQTYAQALMTVKKSTSASKDEYKQVVDVLSEIDSQYASTSYQDYINNTDGVRDSINEVIQNLYEEQEGHVETAKSAYDQSIKTAESMGITKESIGEVATTTDELTKKIDEMPVSKDVEFKANVSDFFMDLWNATKSGVSKVIKFVAESATPKTQTPSSKSVSSAPKVQGLVSANVSSNGAIISSATSSSGKSSSSSSSSTSSSSSSNDKVSQDIWRYWRTEDKLDSLSNAMSDLERAITLAGEDYSKVGQLLQKELNNLKSQQSTLQTYKQAKVHEAQQRLTQLQAYGFKVDKKNLTISNLESQSMKLTGDKASGAEELLNTWHSLVSEIGTIDQQLKDIATSTKDINDRIKENNISKELAVYEDFLDSVEKLQKKIENRKTLNESFVSLISEDDYELLLKMNEKMSNDSSKAIEQLVYKFNKLSLSNIQNAENGTEFLTVLEDLSSQILENADAVIEFTQAINDIEISRVASDLSDMTDAFSDLQDKLSNNRVNLQEGLLSGTSLSDLQSTQLNQLDLSRKNQLSKMAQDRIKLEQKLQEALDGFAVKNVDRTAKVANETLRINAEMYEQLTTIASEYNTGKGISNYTKILSDLSKIVSEKVVDENYGFDTGLEKLYNEMYKKQSELNQKYAEKLVSENYETRLSAEYEYSVESLSLQKMMLEKSIETSRLAIEEYNKQLSDADLTSSQIQTIEDAIKAEEEAIIDAQNSIKDAVSEMYDFKFSKIEELMSKYDELNSVLEYSQSIVEAISPNDLNASFKISEAIKDNTLDRKRALNDIIATLEYEMSLQQQGSYEWNILNAQLSEYKESLQDVNLSLVEMNKQMASLRLENVLNTFEKKLFNGKTLDQYNDFKDLWLTGLEREIALEEIYDKIAEIGTNAFDEKMALLDKQEKISRLEMDYLSKQLEIIELQNKLEDSKQQRTVKTLQQNADGTFDWNYVADEEENSEIEDSIKQAQLELLEMEDSAKESYLSKLEDIIAGIQDGEYEDKSQLKEKLDELSSAYSLILGDIPASLSKLSGEILYAYEQYDLGNSEILDELINSSNATPTIATIDKFREDVVSEIQKLGDKIKSAIENSLISSNVKSVSQYSSHSVSTAQQATPNISISKIDFPNVTSSDEIKDAILNLPKYALQHAKKK